MYWSVFRIWTLEMHVGVISRVVNEAQVMIGYLRVLA